MLKPIISIIIPCYNREHYIAETLDSLLAQDYLNWECFVVDDGSTDDSEKVVDTYSKKDDRIRFFKRPNDKPKGANACRNYGFELSKGDYIQFLDSDDLISNNKLSSQIKMAIDNEAEVITCKWGRFTNANDFRIKESKLYKNYNPAYNLLIDYGNQKSFLPSHTFLVKRDLFLKSGLWNETLKINQDGELFSRVLYRANKIMFDDSCVVKYRSENNNKTSTLSSLEKAKDLTKSWKLISKNLKGKSTQFRSYIEFGKDYAFNVLKQNFKTELFKNFYFYRNQFTNLIVAKLKTK